jgi:hypothetical protein
MWSSFVAIVFLELRRRSPALLFALGLVLAAGLPASLYLFTDHFEHAVVADAVAYICVFNLLYFTTRFMLPGAQVIPDEIDLPGQRLPGVERRLIALVGLLFLTPFVLRLAQANFSFSQLGASSWREVEGLSANLMQYGAHISFGLVLCFVVLRRYVVAGLILVAVVALIVADRRRAMAIAAVGPLLLYLVFWSVRDGVRPLRIVLTLGAGAAAIIAFFLVQQIRYLGPLRNALVADPKQLLESTFIYITSFRGDLSLLDYFLWMLPNGHYIDGYGEIISVQRMLTFYLPGNLKPPEFTHSIATAIRGGEQGASIHPTIYGLSWGEAEWLGTLYAPFLGAVFRALDRIVIRFRGTITWTILLGPYSVFAVLVARGTMYNAWVIMLVTFAIALGLIRVAAFRGDRTLKWATVSAPQPPPGHC